MYSSFYLKSKNNHFLYTQFEDLFLEIKVFYEFGRLRQNRPETAQPASPVVEFTLTSHVHFSLTCGEAGWGQRIWDLETPASFTGGGTGGNIRCGHVCIFFLVQVFLPLLVVSGDPAADVVSSLRDTPIVIRPSLFSPTPLSRPLRRPLRPFYVQIYISRALWLSCMMSMGLACALIAEAAFQ